MKKNAAFFLLLVICTQICAVSIAVRADTTTKEKNYWDSYTGLADQVEVRLKTQLPSHIISELGAPTLVEFKSRLSQKIDNETILYTADLVVDVAVNLGTDLTIERLQPRETTVTERWGTFFFSTDFGRTRVFSYIDQNGPRSRDLNKELGYSGTFRQRDVEVVPTTLQLTHRILNNFNPLSWGLRSPLEFEITVAEPPQSYDFGDTQITIKNRAFLYNVSSAQIVESSRVEQRPYQNIWQSDVSTAVNLIPQKGGAGQQSMTGLVSQVEPGVQSIGVAYQTLIQGNTAPISRGSTLNKLGNNTFILRSPELVPNLVEVRQRYKTKYAEIAVDTETDTLKISPASARLVSSTTGTEKSRTLGWEIKNYADQYTIRINIALYSVCNVEFKQDAPPAPLDKLNNTKEDYYWDNYARGTTEISAREQQSANSLMWGAIGQSIAQWFADYWYVVAIVIVLAIAAVAIYVRSMIPMPTPPQTAGGGGKPVTKKIEMFTFKQVAPREVRSRRKKHRRKNR